MIIPKPVFVPGRLRSYESLGTLCDEPDGLTCSFDAARRCARAGTLKGYPTFEAAAEAVKCGAITSCLVPAAYPGLAALLMDPQLSVDDVFVSVLPPLVLVGRDRNEPRSVEVVFHHPATVRLLDEIGIEYERAVTVTSNTRACVQVLESSTSAAAITNLLSADHYGLRVYRMLRVGLRMPFICLVRAFIKEMPDETNGNHFGEELEQGTGEQLGGDPDGPSCALRSGSLRV
jgi:hypothetical protein